MKLFTNNTFACLILLLTLLLLSCDKAEESNRPTNVVLIFTDDLGYGDLGCYGNPNIASPNIDQLAVDGIRFTSFYVAAAVCSPSRAALLTGRYPIRNSPKNFGPESKNGLLKQEITLANLLGKKGYATAAIGKWHLGHQKGYLPTDRGFDQFYGLPYSNDMILPWCPWLSEKDSLFMYENSQPNKLVGFDQDHLTENYTKKALDFIAKNKEKPFFLYLAHSMPHLPISTSDQFKGKSEGGFYGDVIETLDWSVGEVLRELETHGLSNNTLVIFTSDNGPWNNLPDRMLQRGVERWHTGSTGLLRGSKATSYEGGFRVPAIMRWPGTIEKGTVNRQPVNTMDVFQTILSIADATGPEDRVMDGRDILPLLKGEKMTLNEAFFYCTGTQLQAVRKMNWKLRITKKEGVQLFDLKNDPGENYNIAERNTEQVEVLKKLMIEFSNNSSATIAF